MDGGYNLTVNILITTPNHSQAVQDVQLHDPSPDVMENVLQQVARVAEESLLNYLQGHIRTAQTMSSIRLQTTEKSLNTVSVSVGSVGRGAQLRWLDKGRGEVYPIRAKKLRWISYPEGVVVYAMHSRATQASGCMKNAGDEAIARIGSILTQTLTTPSYSR